MTFARLLAVLAAVLLAASTAHAQAPEPVRLMSYNVRIAVAEDRPSWFERRPHLGAQIAFVNPDILGVQEAKPAVVRWLGRRLEGWERYGVGRDDGAGEGETTTLYWRADRFEAIERETLWCSPTPERPSKGWDAAYPRTITRVVLRERGTGRLWDVRNTHFDHEGEEARRRCADLVVEMEPAEGAHMVLMGDFNAGPDSEPYRRIVASGLADARRISPVVFGPEGTFNAFDIARAGGEAIDHIFLGPELEVLRFGVLTDSFGGQVISDHFPLVADVIPVAR